MNSENSKVWNEKGATLSVKNAVKEYGITHDEIIDMIKVGKLQYRLNYAHGNPYYKLIRNEVESFAKSKYGDSYFEKQKRKIELEIINKQLRKYRKQIKLLEKRKFELEAD
jgi:3'-phosphoadenosine 5'-phosphosulfate sulfotransferase